MPKTRAPLPRPSDAVCKAALDAADAFIASSSLGAAPTPANAGAKSWKALVLSVKEVQRTDPTGNSAWWMFCETHGAGARDPCRHAAPFLQQFLTEYHNGQILDGGNHQSDAYRASMLADLAGPGNSVIAGPGHMRDWQDDVPNGELSRQQFLDSAEGLSDWQVRAVADALLEQQARAAVANGHSASRGHSNYAPLSASRDGVRHPAAVQAWSEGLPNMQGADVAGNLADANNSQKHPMTAVEERLAELIQGFNPAPPAPLPPGAIASRPVRHVEERDVGPMQMSLKDAARHTAKAAFPGDAMGVRGWEASNAPPAQNQRMWQDQIDSEARSWNPAHPGPLCQPMGATTSPLEPGPIERGGRQAVAQPQSWPEGLPNTRGAEAAGNAQHPMSAVKDRLAKLIQGYDPAPEAAVEPVTLPAQARQQPEHRDAALQHMSLKEAARHTAQPACAVDSFGVRGWEASGVQRLWQEQVDATDAEVQAARHHSAMKSGSGDLPSSNMKTLSGDLASFQEAEAAMQQSIQRKREAAMQQSIHMQERQTEDQSFVGVIELPQQRAAARAAAEPSDLEQIAVYPTTKMTRSIDLPSMGSLEGPAPVSLPVGLPWPDRLTEQLQATLPRGIASGHARTCPDLPQLSMENAEAEYEELSVVERSALTGIMTLRGPLERSVAQLAHMSSAASAAARARTPHKPAKVRTSDDLPSIAEMEGLDSASTSAGRARSPEIHPAKVSTWSGDLPSLGGVTPLSPACASAGSFDFTDRVSSRPELQPAKVRTMSGDLPSIDDLDIEPAHASAPRGSPDREALDSVGSTLSKLAHRATDDDQRIRTCPELPEMTEEPESTVLRAPAKRTPPEVVDMDRRLAALGISDLRRHAGPPGLTQHRGSRTWGCDLPIISGLGEPSEAPLRQEERLNVIMEQQVITTEVLELRRAFAPPGLTDHPVSKTWGGELPIITDTEEPNITVQRQKETLSVTMKQKMMASKVADIHRQMGPPGLTDNCVSRSWGGELPILGDHESDVVAESEQDSFSVTMLQRGSAAEAHSLPRDMGPPGLSDHPVWKTWAGDLPVISDADKASASQPSQNKSLSACLQEVMSSKMPEVQQERGYAEAADESPPAQDAQFCHVRPVGLVKQHPPVQPADVRATPMSLQAAAQHEAISARKGALALALGAEAAAAPLARKQNASPDIGNMAMHQSGVEDQRRGSMDQAQLAQLAQLAQWRTWSGDLPYMPVEGGASPSSPNLRSSPDVPAPSVEDWQTRRSMDAASIAATRTRNNWQDMAKKEPPRPSEELPREMRLDELSRLNPGANPRAASDTDATRRAAEHLAAAAHHLAAAHASRGAPSNLLSAEMADAMNNSNSEQDTALRSQMAALIQMFSDRTEKQQAQPLPVNQGLGRNYIEHDDNDLNALRASLQRMGMTQESSRNFMPKQLIAEPEAWQTKHNSPADPMSRGPRIAPGPLQNSNTAPAFNMASGLAPACASACMGGKVWKAAAQAVKNLQRTDPSGHAEWCDYCKVHGGDLRDPCRHNLGFLQQFLAEYRNGSRSKGGGETDGDANCRNPCAGNGRAAGGKKKEASRAAPTLSTRRRP